MAGEVFDGLDLPGLGIVVTHGQGVGVFESQRPEQADAVLLLEVLGGLPQHLVAAGPGVALHGVGPERAGVVDVDVHVAGREGFEELDRPHPRSPVGGVARVAQPLIDQRAEGELLAEVLRADDDRPVAAAGADLPPDREGHQPGKPESQQHGRERHGPPPPPGGRRLLDPPDQKVQQQREHRRRDAADQDRGGVERLDPAEDVIAQRRLADRLGERGDADGPDHGRPQPRDDHRQR